LLRLSFNLVSKVEKRLIWLLWLHLHAFELSGIIILLSGGKAKYRGKISHSNTCHVGIHARHMLFVVCFLLFLFQCVHRARGPWTITFSFLHVFWIRRARGPKTKITCFLLFIDFHLWYVYGTGDMIFPCCMDKIFILFSYHLSVTSKRCLLI